MHGSRANERGLTLVEMMVSLLLLAFVVLGGVALLSQVLTQNRLAQRRSVATHLAAERIEHISSQPFTSAADYLDYRLPGETAAAGPPITLTADYGTIPEFPNYRRVVTLIYDSPIAGMLQVATSVAWEDPRQGQKRHDMVTYLHSELKGL